MGTNKIGAVRRTLRAAKLLATVFTGGASRERLCVLFMLSMQSSQPCAICERLALDKKLINKYMKLLQGAGLVVHKRFGRGVCYRLSPAVAMSIHTRHLRVAVSGGGGPDAAHRSRVFQVFMYTLKEAREELGLGALIEAMLAAKAAAHQANQPPKPAVIEGAAVLEPKARAPKATRRPNGPEHT